MPTLLQRRLIYFKPTQWQTRCDTNTSVVINIAGLSNRTFTFTYACKPFWHMITHVLCVTGT